MAIPCDCCPLQIQRATRLVAPGFLASFASQAGVRTPGPGNAFTFTNFAGSGINVTVTMVGDTIGVSPGPQEPGALTVPASSQRTVTVTVSFSSPIYLRSFGLSDLDFGGNQEYAYDFTPQESNVYGQKVFFPAPGNGTPPSTPGNNPLGVVRGTVGNDTGGVLFDAPLTSSLTFRIFHVAGAGSFLTGVGFDVNNPIHIINLFRCANANIWFDESGIAVNPNDYEDI